MCDFVSVDKCRVYRGLGLVALDSGNAQALLAARECLSRAGGHRRGEACEANFWEGRLGAEISILSRDISGLQKAKEVCCVTCFCQSFFLEVVVCCVICFCQCCFKDFSAC